MTKLDFKPDVCTHCGQELNYILAIDRGTTNIVKQISRFIEKKGINCVHPRKEMEGAYLTSNEVGNLTRARAHGLIAKIKDNPGNYCLTSKGLSYLGGTSIPRFAIISKSKVNSGSMNVGYIVSDPPKKEEFVCIADFNSADDYWEGIGYTIESGRVIKNLTTIS